jgi:hypothetical protein
LFTFPSGKVRKFELGWWAPFKLIGALNEFDLTEQSFSGPSAVGDCGIGYRFLCGRGPYSGRGIRLFIWGCRIFLRFRHGIRDEPTGRNGGSIQSQWKQQMGTPANRHRRICNRRSGAG